MVHLDSLVAEHLGILVSLVLAEDHLGSFDALGLADGCLDSLGALDFVEAVPDNLDVQVPVVVPALPVPVADLLQMVLVVGLWFQAPA